MNILLDVGKIENVLQTDGPSIEADLPSQEVRG